MKLNMQSMMKQLQEVQQRMEKIQAELETKTVSAEAGGGMVRVVVNGRLRVLKIEIERDAIDLDDLSMLEDLVAAAVNKGIEEAQEMAQQEMAKAAGGMIPPIPGLNVPGLA
ncbi:MAG: YbaB/EbfC family nucleoid-associated protein [Bacteroidota bacterium]